MKLLALLACLAYLPGLTACAAASMAKVRIEQSTHRDARILERKPDRQQVAAQLGEPLAAARGRNGTLMQVYRFDPDVPKGGASRWPVIAHMCLSGFTLGLWELVGVGIESMLADRQVTYLLIYDAAERLSQYTAMWQPALPSERERARCDAAGLLAALRVPRPAAPADVFTQADESFRVDRRRHDAYHEGRLKCLLENYAASSRP